ncbi:Guanine nucleotide-binding protein-like nsn1 [Asimina triloba]
MDVTGASSRFRFSLFSVFRLRLLLPALKPRETKMVKKSKKSKSKRVPLRKKYKIIRKVKEHHRKKAKEAKKLGTQRKKVEKDPGIPNDWPFKEQELKALEARRARALEELEQKKAARKERAQKRKLGLLEDDDVAKMADTASVKEHEFEKSTGETSSRASKSRDNSERAFYKELVKLIEASDVILEVLDARDPLGTRCVDIEKLVLKMGPNKHLVLVLNKIDLVPREGVEKWLKYFREELPAVAFRCSTQEQRSNLGWKNSSKAAKLSKSIQTSDCLGAETLIRLLKNYSRSHELKKSITVGVVGLPNVGKSSLINSLKRSHVVNVGATPGLTRTMQEIQLDKNVKLLDCPGVVMLRSSESDVSIALRNCKRIEKLDDPIAPVKDILKLCPAEKLMSLYKLPSFSSVDEFLQKVAMIRGKLKKGGAVDVEAAARIVLRDWNEGKIPYYTLPPVRNEGEILESAIVSELGKEFNVDEIYKEESSFIGSLTSVEDFLHVEVPPHSPLHLDEQMTEDMQPQEVIQEEDQPMACEDNETVETKLNSSNKQNDKLYTAEGILDPRIRRAEKKRRKAHKASMMDADYDFKVDYARKVVNTDDNEDEADGKRDEGNNSDDEQVDGSAPMPGVELEA